MGAVLGSQSVSAPKPLPPAPTPPAPTPADPADFSNKYNTKLSPSEEKQFTEWAQANGKIKDLYDYDVRGFWKDKASFADNGHGSDIYKKPNHPTFSDQSMYHGADGNYGGKWSESNGKVTFTPSASNLKNMSPQQLTDYFKRVEPGVILNLPKGK